jgi:hypothetical protein
VSELSTVSRLWKQGELPIHSGVYLADGRAWSVAVDAASPGGLKVLEPFDVDEFLANDPEFVTSFVVSKLVELPEGAGHLWCGEGSWGSEGLFGRTTPQNELVWVVYLEESNPFVDIEIDGGMARFRSSSGVMVSVDVSGTDFVPAPWSRQGE